jgi:hypothetical protein
MNYFRYSKDFHKKTPAFCAYLPKQAGILVLPKDI